MPFSSAYQQLRLRLLATTTPSQTQALLMRRTQNISRNPARTRRTYTTQQTPTQPPRDPITNPASSTSPAAKEAQTRSRIARVNARLPRFLRHYTTPLLTAPLTHISSFLLLHELTAIIPLFGLAGAFHYFEWLPPVFGEGVWVKTGVEIFGKWARKRGWIDEGVYQSLGKEAEKVEEEERADKQGKHPVRTKWWNRSEGSVRWIVELATAWAVVKVFLPLRIVLSVGLTPAFARLVTIPIGRGVKGLFSKKGARQITNK